MFFVFDEVWKVGLVGVVISDYFKLVDFFSVFVDSGCCVLLSFFCVDCFKVCFQIVVLLKKSGVRMLIVVSDGVSQ